jgi:hypothetical protein
VNPVNFGEIQLSEIPEDHLRSIKIKEWDASHDFFVSIILDDVLIGSGTLVDAWGTIGILTAHHVAIELDKDPFAELCSPLGTRPHRFTIPRQCVEHIPLGRPGRGDEVGGPDLSLLKLSGAQVISTLRSKKSFYRVAGKSFEVFRGMGLEKLLWWFLGAPAEISRPMTSTSDEGALMAKHLVAECDFDDLKDRQDADVLSLKVKAGDYPFPKKYGGVSGGGVWVSALSSEGPDALPTTIEATNCHLAGVAFYQCDSGADDGWTRILANGPRTIDSLLRRFQR